MSSNGLNYYRYMRRVVWRNYIGSRRRRSASFMSSLPQARLGRAKTTKIVFGKWQVVMEIDKGSFWGG